MVLEAQWDRPHSIDRRAVRACLARDRRGEPILASMGSLAHLMQETVGGRHRLRDYIHEGIGQIWADSLEHPARHAGWVLIEEQSEGGDVLAARRRERPDFLADFDRVCEGGGVALYRAEDAAVRSVRPPTLSGTGGRGSPDGQGCLAETTRLELERGTWRRRTAAEIELVAGEVQLRREVGAAALPPELRRRR